MALDTSSARKLGKRALKLGVSVLELAKIHENALVALDTGELLPRARDDQSFRSSAFFRSALVPIEESHFATSEVNHRYEIVIEKLTRRTEDLDRSNKKLLVEISRRTDAEKSLRTSEATTSELLERALEMEKEMRSLSRRLINAQENERKRISRELHDVIAQTLAGINIRLAGLRSQSLANADEFDENMKITERLVEQSVEIVHRFASDLRPVVLDDIGLIPALKSFIDSYTVTYDIPVKLIASPAVEELGPSALVALFRIAQEALTNIGRHSKASLVNISIRPTKNYLRMRIRDNGQGFSVKAETLECDHKPLGILGMRERAEMVDGTFQIDSIVGEGTNIKVDVPRDATEPERLPLTNPIPSRKAEEKI